MNNPGTKKANPGELTPFAYLSTIDSAETDMGIIHDSHLRTTELEFLSYCFLVNPLMRVAVKVRALPWARQPARLFTRSNGVRGTIDSFNVEVAKLVAASRVLSRNRVQIPAIKLYLAKVQKSNALPMISGLSVTERDHKLRSTDLAGSNPAFHTNEMAETGQNPHMKRVIPIRDHTAHCPRAYHRTWPSTAYMSGKGGE